MGPRMLHQGIQAAPPRDAGCSTRGAQSAPRVFVTLDIACLEKLHNGVDALLGGIFKDGVVLLSRGPRCNK